MKRFKRIVIVLIKKVNARLRKRRPGAWEQNWSSDEISESEIL